MYCIFARVDCHQSGVSHMEGPADMEGRKLREDLEEKLHKLQEPAQAKTKKSLPVPEEKKKSKRGGKRIRKMKERFAVTDLQKLQNKMEFKPDVGEYGDSAMGFDNGMVGSKVLLIRY
jgi:U4/U6 small nuclear ribonucleoprotein PRP31